VLSPAVSPSLKTKSPKKAKKAAEPAKSESASVIAKKEEQPKPATPAKRKAAEMEAASAATL
jgi:hypothetical protein